MAELVERLKASGGVESAGFLNKIIEQLWPNINAAAARIVKESVEPVLATSLPGPLSGLRFTKVDLGPVPLEISEVAVHKTDNEGIKLDMDLRWEGRCDIDLDGSGLPKVGIQHIHMDGRLSVLLCPLTNIIPLIGAAQVSFINPPTIKLDFTDAAEIADCFLISKVVRKTILNIISSLAVLPNRFLVKLDSNNDFFKTYLPHLGVLRLTVKGASNVASRDKSSKVKRFFDKIIKDVPDCYCRVNVGAGQVWQTSVCKDSVNPEWNETNDFLVADFDQIIYVDIDDKDLAGDDDIGVGSITVRDVLLSGGEHELTLTHEGEPVDTTVTLHAEFFNLVPDASSVLEAQGSSGDDDEEDKNKGQQLCGVATVLVASALHLSGQVEELVPSVQVSLGEKHKFRTGSKSYSPGVDIFNPSFDTAFNVPINPKHKEESFVIALMNKDDEVGRVEVPFSDILEAPDLVLDQEWDVGAGAVVRAKISLRGLQAAS